MKKYLFFKYFIKIVFADGGRGAGRPVPIGGGVGCSIYPLNIVWGRRRVHENGGRGRDRDRGCLNPHPPRPVVMPNQEKFE